MIYITGDTHGNFKHIREFCKKNKTTTDDIMIILGDAGINYYCDWRDEELKRELSKLPITFLCIHGNHEARPNRFISYHTKLISNAQIRAEVYVEDKYPTIWFAKDGEMYELNNKSYLIMGGAYSVDKQYRQLRGMNWWNDEQPSKFAKDIFEITCNKYLDWQVHGVLTHTCPLKYEPIEVFLPMIDQRKVDKTTEEWLDTIEDKLNYNKWYCGHYHTNKSVDKINFLWKNIIELE